MATNKQCVDLAPGLWTAVRKVCFLIACTLTLHSTSFARAEHLNDFSTFDAKAPEVRELVDYIKTSDWPGALDEIALYKKLGPHQFLYIIKSAPLSSGLFLVDTQTKKQTEHISAFIEWLEKLGVTGSEKAYYLANAFGGGHGRGYSTYWLLQIADSGKVDAWQLYTEVYDMESGGCGRRSLGIERSANVLRYKLEPGRLVFSVVEQDCKTRKKRTLDIGYALDIRMPGFDCARASNLAEKLVCGDTELSRVDGLLSERYQSVLAYAETPKDVRRDQLKWLARRNQCKTIECVRDAYYGRLHVVKNY